MSNVLCPMQQTSFGDMLLLPDVPPGVELVVILVNEGRGWVPKRVLLSHQLYRADVEALLAELTGYPPRCEVAYAPIRSAEIRTVARKMSG